MNKTAVIIAVLLTTATYGFSQFIFTGTGVEDVVLVDTNYTGVGTGPAAQVAFAATLQIGSTTLTGGGGSDAARRR